MAQNPTRQVHALLAGFAQGTLIEKQNYAIKLRGLLHELYSLAMAKNTTDQ
jgi:hypothetical protein